MDIAAFLSDRSIDAAKIAIIVFINYNVICNVIV